jgi:NADH-quinone oxidoreductase subunit H
VSDVWRYALALLVWPGLIGGALLSWLFLWIGRRLTARMQGRQGPPFYQPFYDFVKLLGKVALTPSGMGRALFYGLPVAAVVSLVAALMIIPAPGNPAGQGFSGDLIVLLYLLEMPALIDVLAGYGSRSLYGQVSAAREAVLSLGYNLPFLAALIALAIQAHSFSLSQVAALPFSGVQVLAALAFLLAIPARLRTTPFSIPNAEQEIVAGAHTEYNAAPLGLFELAHGLELVTLAGLFAVLFVPKAGSGWLNLALYLLASLILVALTSALASATARIEINQAFKFYWSWGAAAAGLALIATLVWR